MYLVFTPTPGESCRKRFGSLLLMCFCDVFRVQCTSGGVYAPCIYSHARWVTVGDSGLCCCFTCVTSFER